MPTIAAPLQKRPYPAEVLKERPYSTLLILAARIESFTRKERLQLSMRKC